MCVERAEVKEIVEQALETHDAVNAGEFRVVNERYLNMVEKIDIIFEQNKLIFKLMDNIKDDINREREQKAITCPHNPTFKTILDAIKQQNDTIKEQNARIAVVEKSFHEKVGADRRTQYVLYFILFLITVANFVKDLL